jgi:hypothetical protein
MAPLHYAAMSASENWWRGLKICPAATLGQLFCRKRRPKVTVASADQRQSLLAPLLAQTVVVRAPVGPVRESTGLALLQAAQHAMCLERRAR